MFLTTLPMLSALILFPVLAGTALYWVDAKRVRTLALTAAVLEFLLAALLLTAFDYSSAKMQFVERQIWIPSLNIQYALGVDGISALFPLFTALLTGLVMLSSCTSARSMPRLYYALLLLLEGFTIGVFCSLDLALFFLFWELTLVPVYFLVSLWGIGPERRYAAMKYTLFMLVGGIPLLFGIILLALNHGAINELPVPGGLSFDYPTLLNTPLATDLQHAVFVLLVLGFAVKAPLFPFHTWLPTLAMEGPVGVAALLTGLKLGAYGLLRFAIPLAPEAASHYAWILTGLGITGLLYGALIALRQTNLRRLLAFSSVSHVGLVVVAISTLNLQGLQGAIFQLLNFTLITGGLFLTAGFIQQRFGSTESRDLGGLARPMPLLTAGFFLLGLAAIGVPGTNGFVAEFLMLVGTLRAHLGLGLTALTGMILSAAYFLGFFQRAFLGPVTQGPVARGADLRPRERAILVLLATLCVAFGVFPALITKVTEPAVLAWVKRVGGNFPDHPSAFARLDLRSILAEGGNHAAAHVCSGDRAPRERRVD